jgi:amidase
VPAPIDAAAMHRPPRAAICVDPGGLGVDPRVADAVRKAGDALSNAGYRVTEVDGPDVMLAARLWMQLLMADAQVMMEPAIRKYGSHKINNVFDLYKEALPEFYGNDRPEESLEGYMRGLAARAGVLRDWTLFLEEHGVFVGPVSAEPPFHVGDDEISASRSAEIWRANRLTLCHNLTGLPSAAVPTGPVEGVPLGVQIIAQRYREDRALDAAQAVEDACGGATPIDPQW